METQLAYPSTTYDARHLQVGKRYSYCRHHRLLLRRLFGVRGVEENCRRVVYLQRESFDVEKLFEGSAVHKRKKISASAARQHRGVNEDIQTCFRAHASTLIIYSILIHFEFALTKKTCYCSISLISIFSQQKHVKMMMIYNLTSRPHSIVNDEGN